MTNKQQAARNLAQRAIHAERQSESNLLIAAAKSLDSTIDTAQLKAAWLEKWLLQNQNRKGHS